MDHHPLRRCSRCRCWIFARPWCHFNWHWVSHWDGVASTRTIVLQVLLSILIPFALPENRLPVIVTLTKSVWYPKTTRNSSGNGCPQFTNETLEKCRLTAIVGP